MNTVKEVALSIASELKEHPEHWCQGAYQYEDKACLVGHFQKRNPESDTILQSQWHEAMLTSFYEAADTYSMVGWNDTDGRTVQDVIALCEKVAQHE